MIFQAVIIQAKALKLEVENKQTKTMPKVPKVENQMPEEFGSYNSKVCILRIR